MALKPMEETLQVDASEGERPLDISVSIAKVPPNCTTSYWDGNTDTRFICNKRKASSTLITEKTQIRKNLKEPSHVKGT